jgi:hypothetical protein
VNQTFNVILKYEGDVRKAQAELDKLLQKKAGEARAAKPAAATPSRARRDEEGRAALGPGGWHRRPLERTATSDFTVGRP